MFSDDNHDQKIHLNEQKIRELSIRVESLDRETTSLLNELKVTPDQLTKFVDKRENFTEKNWDELNKHKKAADEKLERELRHVTNPKKVKETFKELNVGRNWLFVR